MMLGALPISDTKVPDFTDKAAPDQMLPLKDLEDDERYRKDD
jgi:hypothetical protein